ncbi:hypothetical protein JCM10450v2_007343 [Rhodotorula kratochvilovae]
MAVLSLPDLPGGANPYALIYERIHYALNPVPTPGFAARLYVLGIVVSAVYLCAMFVEYRRREKRFWLWKLVTRPNGRYIVGNQHALFAVFSFISCAVFLGYNTNFRRVVILHEYQQRAYFWRSLIWLPLILHAWISSWSNLQAAVLSSQKATKRHLLSPVFANCFYVVGLVVVLVPVIVLDVYSSTAWRNAWNFGLNLRALLLSGIANNSTDSPEQALAAIDPLFSKLNDKLGFFLRLIRADHFVYAFAMVAIIGVNLGGLGLLFTLRRQIQFNSRRLSTQIRHSTINAQTSVHGIPVLSTGPDHSSTSSSPPDSPYPPHPLSPDPNQSGVPQKTLLRHVFFARQGSEGEEEKQMSVSKLKDAAQDKTPAGAVQRQQAKQLLALKKIEWDLVVFLAAIVLMATVFLALALWLAIAPNSVYSSWKTMEVAFFLVPWMYLVSVDASITFLLFNTVRHLLSANSRLAHVVGLGGQGTRVDRRRTSVTGLTTSDELESGTISYARPSRAGELQDVDEEDESERGVHVAIETEVVEESSEAAPIVSRLQSFDRV